MLNFKDQSFKNLVSAEDSSADSVAVSAFMFLLVSRTLIDDSVGIQSSSDFIFHILYTRSLQRNVLKSIFHTVVVPGGRFRIS